MPNASSNTLPFTNQKSEKKKLSNMKQHSNLQWSQNHEMHTYTDVSSDSREILPICRERYSITLDFSI